MSCLSCDLSKVGLKQQLDHSLLPVQCRPGDPIILMKCNKQSEVSAQLQKQMGPFSCQGLSSQTTVWEVASWVCPRDVRYILQWDSNLEVGPRPRNNWRRRKPIQHKQVVRLTTLLCYCWTVVVGLAATLLTDTDLLHETWLSGESPLHILPV